MPTPIDPTAAAFLIAESRRQPMHVAALQLFEPPDDATSSPGRELYEQAIASTQVRPLFRKHPVRTLRTAGQLIWDEDREFDIEHHVRHNALPQPGRVRELLELCSRLHGTVMARERPLWETHLVDGLADGRFAMYTKVHHALLDGVAAMRLMQSTLSTDPGKRGMPLPFMAAPRRARPDADPEFAVASLQALRTAFGLAADAAGMPAALTRTVLKGIRNETSAMSLYAPRTMFNVTITGSRRFAAQDWPIERLRGVGKAANATLNDVVLAMCAGAVRAYLLEQQALPDTSLVAMVPVALKARRSGPATDGGNAVGAVMVRLGTDLADPAARLRGVRRSMRSGKEALKTMTPNQILAMSALGMAPSVLTPMLRMHGVLRPPFNLIISNVPGPRATQYFNGMRMVGSYPASIPMNGMALNITCNSYADDLCFGLTGCRRSVPHLQHLLGLLDDELNALERAVGA